jgi:thiol-disulfide isomerase/thioredoxin
VKATGMRAAWALAAALLAGSAMAALPPAYAPLVLQPTGLPERAEFDLTAAVAQARREGKRLYVYLGASDCPFCRRYEAFLAKNADELRPHFAGWLIVDLRSSLRVQADRLHIRVGSQSLPYAEFQRSIGDERARQLVYPCSTAR